MLYFNNYTLFLDRDGVINKRLIDEYVLSWKQFEFTERAKDSIKIFSSIFNRIFIVTNQQGIGKGLMTESDLTEIHAQMQNEIQQAGGRIDAIFHCPYLKAKKSFLRKPNIGMALQAKHKFTEVNFKTSVMVGDSLSDMQFGKRAGMKTIFITNETETARKYPHLIDYRFPSLFEFAQELDSCIKTK